MGCKNGETDGDGVDGGDEVVKTQNNLMGRP